MSPLWLTVRSPTFALAVAGGAGLAAGIVSLAVDDLQDLVQHSAPGAEAQPASRLRAELGLILAATRVLQDFYLLAALGQLAGASVARAWVKRIFGAFVATGLFGVGKLAALQTRLLAVVMLRLALRLVERLLGLEVRGGWEAAFFIIAVVLAWLAGLVITGAARPGAAPTPAGR